MDILRKATNSIKILMQTKIQQKLSRTSKATSETILCPFCTWFLIDLTLLKLFLHLKGIRSLKKRHYATDSDGCMVKTDHSVKKVFLCLFENSPYCLYRSWALCALESEHKVQFTSGHFKQDKDINFECCVALLSFYT